MQEVAALLPPFTKQVNFETHPIPSGCLSSHYINCDETQQNILLSL